MSSDISRQTFDATKHYTKIIMQQGRVQLDADWNEQQDIIQHRNKIQTLDMVGQSGAPSMDGGFKLTFTPGSHDFLISPGRIYVDGILCELHEFTAVATQGFHKQQHGVQVPLWPVDGRPWTKGEWIELLDDRQQRVRIFQIRDVVKENSDERADFLVLVLDTNFSNPRVSDADQKKIQTVRRVLTYSTQPPFPDSTSLTPPSNLPQLALEDDSILLLAYLNVWERLVTALEDTRLREVALDGPETTTRLQTAWRVRILPIKITDDKIRKLVEEENKQEKEQPRHYGELYAERADLRASTTRNNEKTLRIAAIDSELTTIDQRVEKIIEHLNGYDCNTPLPEWNAWLASPTGKLTATTYDAANPGASGYRGLQNQLYRVEIHETEANGVPLEFKWARNNASLTTLVEVQGNTVVVQDTGQGGILNFSRGQYIEVLHDGEHDPHAVSGKLIQITVVDTLENRLTLASSPGSNDTRIKIRLWDSAIAFKDQYKDKTWEPMPLEEGITIQFSKGTFCNGDYWLIPARTITREIEWPPYHKPNTTPIPQPRVGIQHHYSRLARIRLFQGQGQHYDKTISDCRIQFKPLPRVIHAMHVSSINWNNDSLHSRKRLRETKEREKEEGLRIELDWEPHPSSIRPETLIVTLETNLPGGSEGIFIMHGHIEVQGKLITWHWLKREGRGFLAELFENSDDWYRDLLGKPEYYARIRVILKGHAIWGSRDHHTIYLDGQSFAMSGGFDPHFGKERSILRLPSGDGMRASDFESWFYIKE